MSIKRIKNDGSLRNTIGDKVNETDPRLSDQRTPLDNSVTSAKIVDGTIVNADVSTSAAIAQSKVSGLTTDLAAKAPLSSPTFTGTPAAPTAASGTNTTQLATTAFVQDADAAQISYETPLTDQSGTTYTFVLADARRITRATNASAKTFTIPPQTSVTWANNTIIRVVNSGAGALTVNGGSGVTVTNTATTIGQFQAASAIRTGSNAWTLVPFSGGVSDADFSNTATGSGTGFKYVTFNSSGTLTVTKAGIAEILTVAGGGGGGREAFGANCSGAGAGGLVYATYFLNQQNYSIFIGAGGAGSTDGAESWIEESANIGIVTATGGGRGGGGFGQTSGRGGSGGGGGDTAPGSGMPGQGRAGASGIQSGGGGAGGVGLASGSGGTGGSGRSFSITGTSITYAVGGNGNGTGGAGTANRGNGGAANYGGTGFSGGSGVVIVRVKV